MVNIKKSPQCTIRGNLDRKKVEGAFKARNKELERLSIAQEETKKALLNVMEDLESAKAVIELEKAKDEAMLASIGEGLIAVDNDRKVIVVNKVAENLLGWEKKDLLGKKITDMVLEDEEGNFMPLSKRPTTIAFATGEVSKVDYFYVRKDKTRFAITITATPIKLNGRTIGLVEIIRDVTQEKEIDKAKSEFISLASHQLRTPLGIIKWYLEALGNQAYLNEAPKAVREYFDEINKNNERVLRLVRDLLSVSRIEQKRIKNEPQLVDLVEVVKEVVRQMQIIANVKGVKLHLLVKDKKIPPVDIDKLRFHEVVENLVCNAVEYVKAFGTVDVTVYRVNKFVFVSIKDTGIGISSTDQKKIFTKFFRSTKAITHNPEGTGLGLYLVKSYVEGWGGKISVESAEGKGSTFTISLPIT